MNISFLNIFSAFLANMIIQVVTVRYILVFIKQTRRAMYEEGITVPMLRYKISVFISILLQNLLLMVYCILKYINPEKYVIGLDIGITILVCFSTLFGNLVRILFLYTLTSYLVVANTTIQRPEIDNVAIKLFYGNITILIFTVVFSFIPVYGLSVKRDNFYIFGMVFYNSMGAYVLFQMLFFLQALRLKSEYLKMKLIVLEEINRLSLINIDENYLRKVLTVTERFKTYIYSTWWILSIIFISFGSSQFLLRYSTYLNLFSCVVGPYGNLFTITSLIYLASISSTAQVVPYEFHD